MSDNRRDFFKKAAGAAVGLAGAETLLGSSSAAAVKQSFGSARLALQLEEEMVGMLSSLEGGEPEAEVVEIPTEDCVVLKGLGSIRYNQISMSFGRNMAQSLYDWIAAGLTCEGVKSARSGAIITADINYNEVAHVGFSQALLAAFTIPAADGAAKDSGSLNLKIEPFSTQRHKGSGKMVLPCATKNQTKFLTSNFRLTIDDLDCKKVSKIESMTILWEGDRDGEKKRSIRFPNLVVSLPETAAQPFFDWHEEFVMNEKRNEKSGTLEFMSPNLQETLLTVSFKALGIFKVGPDKMSANAEAIKRVTAEMYCNGMSFTVGKNVGC